MAKQFRLMGTNDDHNTCEFCGRTNLKRVVMLAPLDPDGNVEGEAAPYGTSCAATLLGYTWKDPKGSRFVKNAVEAEALAIEVNKLVDFYRATKARTDLKVSPVSRVINRWGCPMASLSVEDHLITLVDRDTNDQPHTDAELIAQAIKRYTEDVTWARCAGDGLDCLIRQGFRKATGVHLYAHGYEVLSTNPTATEAQ